MSFIKKLTEDEKVILGFASPTFKDDLDQESLLRLIILDLDMRFSNPRPSYYRESAGLNMIDHATITIHHKENLKLYESGILDDGFVIIRDCVNRQVVDKARQNKKHNQRYSIQKLDQNKKKGLGYRRSVE